MGWRSPSARLLPLLTLTGALLLLTARIDPHGMDGGPGCATRPASARPSPCPSHPPAQGLAFDPPVLDVGRLDPGEVRELAVAWRREGEGDLGVLGVVSTCGCVVAGKLPRDLAPGASGTLELRVGGLRRPGPFRVDVKAYLRPSAGQRPVSLPPLRPTLLAVHGHVDTPLALRPSVLDLGPRQAGARLERHVDVEVTRALAHAPLRVRLEGVDGDVVQGPPLFAGRPGASLELALRIPADPGPFEGRLVVEVAGGPATGAPVTGRAVRSRVVRR